MNGTPRKLTMLHARGIDLHRNVPSVLFSGLWLKDCGFAPGDKVQIDSKCLTPIRRAYTPGNG